MATSITAKYIQKNYSRLSGWLGAIRMSSKKTSDLDASLWLLAHHFESEDTLEDTLTFKAWKKRTFTPDYKTRRYYIDPYLFEILESSLFQVLFEHNIIAGVRTVFPTAFLRLSSEILKSRSISVYDISDSLKFQTPNHRNVIIKSKTTEDIVCIRQSLDYILVNDRYGCFLEMMEKPTETFVNKDYDRQEALDLFNFLELDQDLCIKQYMNLMLGYKVYERFYQTHDFETKLNNRIMKVKQVLGLFYTDTQIEKAFLLYDLHRDNNQVIYNLKNMNQVITNELPEMFPLI